MLLVFCSREILDHQDGNIEDDGLTGLLRLATSVVKHKPPFKFSREGQVTTKILKETKQRMLTPCPS